MAHEAKTQMSSRGNSSLTPRARGRAVALQVAGVLSPPSYWTCYWCLLQVSYRYRAPLRVGDIISVE
jgi:hypothetical protein